MKNPVYITTSIPYVNAKPHIGHALELVQADALARYYRRQNRRTIFQTGTDENAEKNVRAAQNQGVPVQEFVDKNSERFRSLAHSLDISFDTFVRTSQEKHRKGVEAFWRRIKVDDFYERRYTGLYCLGCEDFYLARDLVEGKCPEHGSRPAQIDEQNVFFRLSKYQDAILQLIKSNRMRIIPEQRRQEALTFVKTGLEDLSVSRPVERMGGWGIPVPGYKMQIIYVWIDALMNYVTGQGSDDKRWQSVWNKNVEKCHIIGKNVWKFHTVYWPALLLAAGLPVPDTVYVHGFLTVEGKKISKSLRNGIDPVQTTAEYGSDGVRTYLLSLSPFADGDYSDRRQRDIYNSVLSGGVGNLVTRITTLCGRAGVRGVVARQTNPAGYCAAFEEFRFDRAFETVTLEINALNRDIQRDRAWDLIADQRGLEIIRSYAERLGGLMTLLEPFIPGTANRVLAALCAERLERMPPLFPRIGGDPTETSH